MPLGITLDGQGPLFKQIGRAVTAQILNGRYKRGDRLPSEAELTALFNTSRQTVNKAITELAKQGLVERNRRAGTIVSWQFQERFALPLTDIGDAVSADGRSYILRQIDRRVTTNGRDGVNWPALPDGARLLYLEILHLADDRPVQLEVRYLNDAAFPQVEQESFAVAAPSKWLLAHIPWSRADHSLRALAADAALAGKLAVPVGAACLVVERQTFHKGEPITFVRMTYPDHFTIRGTMDFENNAD